MLSERQETILNIVKEQSPIGPGNTYYVGID